MRNSLSVVAVLAAVAAACNLSPGRSCKTDGDCGANAICVVEHQTCMMQERLTILEPAAGVKIGAQARVRVSLFVDPARSLPATLVATAQKAGGGSETATLTRNGAEYEGTFSPTTEGGYTLQVALPEASLSSSVNLTADLTGPVLTFDALTYPARPPSGSTTYADFDAGFAQSFRRKEKRKFTVRSAATDVAAETVQVQVFGFNGTGRGDGLPPAAITRVDCAEGYCGEFEVDFAAPQLKAFRGTFEVVATGADVVGNAATLTAPLALKVTRFGWAFDSGAVNSLTAPSIADDGSIFFGNAGSTKLHVVRHDGTAGRDLGTTGIVTTSPSMGAGPNQRVYFAVSTGVGPVLHAVRASDGADAKSCTGLGAASETIPTGLAVTVAGGFESGIGIATTAADNGTFAVVRPSAGTTCLVSTAATVPSTSAPSSVVISGQDAYFGNELGELVRYRFESPSWVQKAKLDISVADVTPLGIADSLVVSGTTAGTKGAELDLSTASWAPPDAASTSPAAVGQANVAYYGGSGSRLFATRTRTNTSVEVGASATARSTPLIGRDQLVYFMTGTFLDVRKALTLDQEWSINIGTATAGALAIDCARDATSAKVSGPGLLLVPTTQGKLFAFDVDSKGLDVSAPWPKYQRDPRNTGNANTDLAQFDCP